MDIDTFLWALELRRQREMLEKVAEGADGVFGGRAAGLPRSDQPRPFPTPRGPLPARATQPPSGGTIVAPWVSREQAQASLSPREYRQAVFAGEQGQPAQPAQATASYPLRQVEQAPVGAPAASGTTHWGPMSARVEDVFRTAYPPSERPIPPELRGQGIVSPEPGRESRTAPGVSVAPRPTQGVPVGSPATERTPQVPPSQATRAAPQGLVQDGRYQAEKVRQAKQQDQLLDRLHGKDPHAQTGRQGGAFNALMGRRRATEVASEKADQLRSVGQHGEAPKGVSQTYWNIAGSAQRERIQRAADEGRIQSSAGSAQPSQPIPRGSVMAGGQVKQLGAQPPKASAQQADKPQMYRGLPVTQAQAVPGKPGEARQTMVRSGQGWNAALQGLGYGAKDAANPVLQNSFRMMRAASGQGSMLRPGEILNQAGQGVGINQGELNRGREIRARGQAQKDQGTSQGAQALRTQVGLPAQPAVPTRPVAPAQAAPPASMAQSPAGNFQGGAPALQQAAQAQQQRVGGNPALVSPGYRQALPAPTPTAQPVAPPAAAPVQPVSQNTRSFINQGRAQVQAQMAPKPAAPDPTFQPTPSVAGRTPAPKVPAAAPAPTSVASRLGTVTPLRPAAAPRMLQ